MRHKIQKLLDEQVNPSVASHGGKIEVVDYVNHVLSIRMTGGCQGCSSSQATLKNGVEQAVFNAFPKVREVVDVTEHELGENPFYMH
ncbi:MAG: NifU family protein [Deltaproteobacteria bacterium]|nr:NifU family protein [Deltaproteobacteria bacterium]